MRRQRVRFAMAYYPCSSFGMRTPSGSWVGLTLGFGHLVVAHDFQGAHQGGMVLVACAVGRAD
jgi:hypothetical protein